MPKNALVIVRYGPYSAVGLPVEYRTFRLEGLQGETNTSPTCLIIHLFSWDVCFRGTRILVCPVLCCVPVSRTVPAVLAKDGHKVTLQKIQDWNVVELVVNEEVVFSCNIKDLEFGGDGKLDPLCEKARIAVLNAY
ncbi:UPF0728 protein C10orf53 homolog isoform X1 [Suricata suricatta]|uniref:UPF0728 protein C10orf53 homolog isoform X1 n=1 Tax=Suricata suricatta TaxID=37032 RepID=UPI001155C45E|nr:UPF0728 protein C10orf53 homolog isoform X1 [Suricata suricatta]